MYQYTDANNLINLYFMINIVITCINLIRLTWEFSFDVGTAQLYCRGSPQSVLLKLNWQNYVCTGWKEKRRNLPYRLQKLSIHDDKVCTTSFFTLCLTRLMSLIKHALHALKEGLIPLKKLLFLCFQMFQQTRITISIKQGPENFRVALFSISGP
jgi:hypothetical protein